MSRSERSGGPIDVAEQREPIKAHKLQEEPWGGWVRDEDSRTASCGKVLSGAEAFGREDVEIRDEGEWLGVFYRSLCSACFPWVAEAIRGLEQAEGSGLLSLVLTAVYDHQACSPDASGIHRVSSCQ